MAPTPSSKSHTPRSKFNQILHRTPQFKHRLNNLGAKEIPAAEHPVEVIGRIRDNPENDPILQINADRNSLRVKTEIGYRDFTLDGVSSSENDDLGSFYNKFIESRINGVKLGEKCTIMMYGPTGSGKSYTMFGCGKQPGIVYRSLRGILGEDDEENEGLGSFVQVTVLEIYNEEIYDLLSTNGGGGLGWPKGNSSKVRLEVMGKKAKNATFISGTGAGKISKEIQSVEKRRIVKSTLCNERSSRSHCMIILDVPTVGGRLMLVDMAGSENIEQAGQIGFEAKMQTGKINQGNIALKRVVESIANGDSHVPFRDSKLTMLLQDSFEDDKSKILMVLCASPDSKEMHKTISTLEYGAKAKCIVRGPHMPIKDKIGNEESFLAMNQFVLKLQMENKLKEKERKEAQKELTLKEEEISSLKAKLAKVESTGSSEEEINRKVNERTEMIKRELEKKILECEKMASQFIELEKRKMEEKILQQQKEVEMLKRRVEDTELELIRAKERNGEDYKATEIYEHGLAKRLLDMYADEDPGMVKSMDLDRSMDFDNKPIFAHNPVNNSNVVFMNNINLLANNSDEDHAVYDTNFSSKVPLSTVFEDEEEDEDEEKLDEEVQKEVIEEKTIYSSSSKELNVHSLDYLKDQLGENYTNLESRGEVKSANTTAFNRNERIENIFTLCGNYREISYPNETPVKTNGGNVVDNSVSLDKSMSQKIGNFDITKFDLKENHEPVSNGDEVEVQVQWEVSKDQPGKLITSLKVVKDATIADLRKLIEIHFGANKQGFVFLAHEDSTGAPPVLKKKEATMPLTKLPLCTQTKVHLAYLCPLSEEKQFYPNQPPFTPLQNILNVTVTKVMMMKIILNINDDFLLLCAVYCQIFPVLNKFAVNLPEH